MRKVAESKINIQNKEAMKVMEQKIKQLKDELDLKVDLVKKIKMAPATSTNTRKTPKRQNNNDSSILDSHRSKNENVLDNSFRLKDLDVKKVESKKINGAYEESSDVSLNYDEVSTSATKKGFLPQIENRIVPNMKNNGQVNPGSKKFKARSVSANVRDSQSMEEINEKSNNILDSSLGEIIPERKKDDLINDSSVMEEGKSRRMKADFVTLADKHKNLLEKYEALMEKLVKERKKFEDSKIALVKQHEKDMLELRKINSEFSKEVSEIKKEYEFQTSMNTQKGEERQILYKKIVSLERINGVVLKENDDLRKKNENLETKIRRLEGDLLSLRMGQKILNPVDGKSLSPEGRNMMGRREPKNENTSTQQINKYKLAPLKKKVFEADKSEADKKKREYFVDQYESIIFELVRFTEEKILEGLKKKYPALEKFIISLKEAGLETPSKVNQAQKPQLEQKEGKKHEMTDFNDLDSNFNSCEEDLGLYPEAGRMDSNPDDN